MFARLKIWGVILAGGEGKRLRPYIQSVYNDVRPKQFATLFGNKSMLKATLDRVKKLIPPERQYIAITRTHLPYVAEQFGDALAETVVVQPFCRDTAPGILLPLLHIRKRDHNALVIIFPSDHFILEEDRFMVHVADAARFICTHQNFILLLGMVPHSTVTDYGWIVKGSELAHDDTGVFYRVNGFYEKPSPNVASVLQDTGALWNTLVIVGSINMFIDQFRTLTPEIYARLNEVSIAIGTSQEQSVVDRVFTQIPSSNFSHTILTRIPHHLCVMQISDVYWSDWGDEQRIRHDVKRLGIQLYHHSRA